MKHTKKCRSCEAPLIVGENCTEKRIAHSMYFCQPCERIEVQQRSMYVDGKYIPKSHPLYRPGKFKTFEGAAFSALSNYETSNEGYVYVITNPCWKGWIKVGMAIDSEDRCKQYQTSSPFRDYKLEYSKGFENRRTAEREAHEKCNAICKQRNGEWFELDIDKAIDIIHNINEEKYE